MSKKTNIKTNISKKKSNNHENVIKKCTTQKQKTSLSTLQNRNVQLQKLTKKELKVLHYLTNEFLTPKKIASLCKFSIRRYYQIRKSLINKGYLHQKLHKKIKGGTTPPKFHFTPEKEIRLHGVQITFKLLEKSQKYYKLYKPNKYYQSKNGDSIVTHANTINAYINRDFWGSDPDEAFKKLLSYIPYLASDIENTFKCTILKAGNSNIKIVSSHYAKVNDPIAKDYSEKDTKIKCIAKDGKTWLITDKSFNMDELEFIHPTNSKNDSEKIIKIMDQFHDHDLLEPKNMFNLVTDTKNDLKTLTTSIKHLSDSMNIFIRSQTNQYTQTHPKSENKDKPYYIN